ncbi:hypothetical protein VTO42DRAFT_4037 [Malbranchea cinnamomea]
MNPRRSSRARPNPPSTTMQHTNPSSSSTAIGRPERNTRSNNKVSPSRRASTQRSQSLDDAADPGSRNETLHTRHRQRSRDEDENNHLSPVNDEYDEEEGDEEEITRCICGQSDFPGLPPPSRALLGRISRKSGAKEELNPNASAAASDSLADEPGSLFIQCDACKVWQHGGCVGIMDEAACPEEYFCEECRKDLHRIITYSDGQKCSHYIPVIGPQSPASSSSSRDNSRNSRDKKPKNDPTTVGTKRRSTMNSRDAAYDEEEQLRRAIEESKEESKFILEDTGNGKGKRRRSDSEVNKQATKRQRTASPSPSKQSSSQSGSDDEGKPKSGANGNNKKTRATAARNQREKESDVEKEVENETAPEPAGRRKGRSERRKGEDEPEPPEASPSKASSNPPAQSTADTPETAPESAAPKASTRKTGRPARRGRVGRNQYTRDRDVNGNMDGSYTNGNSPRRGQSRDGANGDSPTGANGVQLNGGESGRPSRPRYMNPNRTTMNDMRKRVAAILEFISRMQVEMAASAEQATPPNDEEGKVSSKPSLVEAAFLVQNAANGDSSTPTSKTQNGDDTPKERDFKELSSVEMMDVLTRGLLKWQQEYGKYGDK